MNNEDKKRKRDQDKQNNVDSFFKQIIEKIIEQIANASNINYYVGPALEIKLRRQELIKIIIDLVDVQYNTLFITSIIKS